MCFVLRISFQTYSFTWYENARVEHPLLPTNDFTIETKSFLPNNRNMDKGMGSSLLTEKLDRSNYKYWSYKMH